MKDVEVYKKHYQLEHGRPDLLREAVYGLPEIYRKEVKGARIVANPGCFPTGAILGLAPLLRAGLISTKGIIVDSKSGVSGAGRGLSRNTHFCEVNEGFKAYGVGIIAMLRIEQELSAAAGRRYQLPYPAPGADEPRHSYHRLCRDETGVRPDEIPRGFGGILWQ